MDTAFIIGNGESRNIFPIDTLKGNGVVYGCNAIYRDYVTEYLCCADRHMCQQAVNAVGKGTTIYTRDKWADQFAHWPNVKKFPDLPYSGEKRQDEPFHWGTGPYAGVLGLTFKPKAIFMLGFDLHPLEKDKVNNMYDGTEGYTYIKRPVDPSYWIYQFHKLMGYSDPDTRWIVVNHDRWEMPKEWSQHGNVFQETYEGLHKYFQKLIKK